MSHGCQHQGVDQAASGGVLRLHCPHCGQGLPRLQTGVMFCPFCGCRLPEQRLENAYCAHCGTPRDRQGPGSQPSMDPPQVERAAYSNPVESRGAPRVGPADALPPRPGHVPCERTAAMMSIVPGLGQVYNGQFYRGLLFFVTTFALFPVGLLIWAYSIWHANKTAKRIRARVARPLSAPPPPPRPQRRGMEIRA